MKIESILRRKGGTKIVLGSIEYHFKPNAVGNEIAEVENPDHIGRLLSIREGYRLIGDAVPKQEAPAREVSTAAIGTSEALSGVDSVEVYDERSVFYRAEQELIAEGRISTPADAPQAEPANEQIEAPAGEQPEPETEPHIDALDDMDRNTLAQKYLEAFGAPPPARTPKAAIAQALRELAASK